MPTLHIKTLRYQIGFEVVAEVPVTTSPLHLSTEVFLNGLYCNCRGSVLAGEPDVMVMDCVPYQYATSEE